MDPSTLYTLPACTEKEMVTILAGSDQGEGHVFNLDHGAHQDVPPEYVGVFVETVHRLFEQHRR